MTCSSLSAPFNDMPHFFVRYAVTMVGDWDTATEQEIKILPDFELSMIVLASSLALPIDEEGDK
jgi:hypothetical protein